MRASEPSARARRRCFPALSAFAAHNVGGHQEWLQEPLSGSVTRRALALSRPTTPSKDLFVHRIGIIGAGLSLARRRDQGELRGGKQGTRVPRPSTSRLHSAVATSHVAGATATPGAVAQATTPAVIAQEPVAAGRGIDAAQDDRVGRAANLVRHRRPDRPARRSRVCRDWGGALRWQDLVVMAIGYKPDRRGRHRRLPPALHAPQLQDLSPDTRALRRAWLGCRGGAADRVGLQSPDAPPLQRSTRGSTQPARRSRHGLERSAFRGLLHAHIGWLIVKLPKAQRRRNTRPISSPIR